MGTKEHQKERDRVCVSISTESVRTGSGSTFLGSNPASQSKALHTDIDPCVRGVGGWGGEPVQMAGPRRSERGLRGPTMLHILRSGHPVVLKLHS